MADAKPTPEELEASTKQAEEELAQAVENGDRLSDDDQGDNSDDNSTDTDDSGEGESQEPDATEKKSVDSKENKPAQDYEKKFKASARETQKLYASNRKLNQAIIEAAEIKEPTTEELTQEYPEWEDLTDTEKRLAKDNYVNKRRFSLIEKGSKEADKIEGWNDQVNEYVDDPKTVIDFPELDGKLDEFSKYAMTEDNRNIPLSTLVGSFLYQKSLDTKSREKANKGEMFPSGSAGPIDKGKKSEPGKLNATEADKLMRNNYTEWKKALNDGRIDPAGMV